MSNEAINWAYQQEGIGAGAKFVLVALADYADQEWSCYPSQERLASMTAQTVRGVRNQIKVLVELGLLVVEERWVDGHRRTNRYYLNPERRSGTESVIPERGSVHTGTGRQFDGERRSPNPLEEPLENLLVTGTPETDTLVGVLDPHRPTTSRATVAAVDVEFETFWKAYPRKVGKGAAVKAYRAARRKASLTEILAGLDAYRTNKPDWQDYAHPSSWLNAERWADDYGRPDPVAAAPVSRELPEDLDPDDVGAYLRIMEGRS